MRLKSLSLIFCGTLLLFWAAAAQASLLGTDWGATSSLYSIDTGTGTATLIGATGQPNMIGLVVDVDSTVYAMSEESNSGLWTLNPTTGAATLVGRVGFNLQEGDMTIDPVSGQMYVADGAGDTLYTVDKTTGAATLVGSFGSLGRDVSGMQFLNGTLYGLALHDSGPDELISIDQTTAATTLIGDTGTNFGVIAAMGRDPANGNVYIAGPATSFGNDNQLYTVDLTTGVATLVGSLSGVNFSISGFSVSGNPIILNPTPEPALFPLVGCGLIALGWRVRRKLRS